MDLSVRLPTYPASVVAATVAMVAAAAALHDDARVADMIRLARKDPTLSEAAIVESFANTQATATRPRHPGLSMQVLKEAKTDGTAVVSAGDSPQMQNQRNPSRCKTSG